MATNKIFLEGGVEGEGERRGRKRERMEEKGGADSEDTCDRHEQFM